MTKARFDEIKQHFGQEHAGGLRTETIAAAKDLIAEVEAHGKFDDEPEETVFSEADGKSEVRRTSGARKK